MLHDEDPIILHPDDDYHPEMVILWSGIALIFWIIVVAIICFFWPADAHADDSALWHTAMDAKAEVDGKYEYLFYYGYNRPKDAKPNEMNCVGFASAYMGELLRRGVDDASYVSCTTRKGMRHRYVKVGRYVLDNRFSGVRLEHQQDCK